MSTLLIGYDLNRSGQNYDELIAAIKSLGNWWHHLESTWLVKTSLGPVQVTDQLKAHIDNNDELLVVDITGDAAAWTGFNQHGSQWLQNNL